MPTSAADATAHLIENPLVPGWLDHPLVITIVLLLFLGAIFLQGFKEALTLAVVLVWIALIFNAPLEGLADPSHTPNPAKAPWYFLGLREMLHYFPPVVAGVMVPGLVVMAVNVSVLVVEVAVAMFATASVAAAAVTVAAMIILRICVRSLVDRMRLLLFI